MWLASDNRWARHRLKRVTWRSWWIVLCTVKQRMEVSHEISQADRWLFGWSFWLSMRSSTATCQMHGCWTIVPILQILFSRLSIISSVQPKSGNSCNSLCAPYRFDRQIMRHAFTDPHLDYLSIIIDNNTQQVAYHSSIRWKTFQFQQPLRLGFYCIFIPLFVFYFSLFLASSSSTLGSYYNFLSKRCHFVW